MTEIPSIYDPKGAPARLLKILDDHFEEETFSTLKGNKYGWELFVYFPEKVLVSQTFSEQYIEEIIGNEDLLSKIKKGFEARRRIEPLIDKEPSVWRAKAEYRREYREEIRAKDKETLKRLNEEQKSGNC